MFALTRGANRLVKGCRTRGKQFDIRSWRYLWPETRKCLSTSGSKLSDWEDKPGGGSYRSHEDNPVRRTFNILSDDVKGYLGLRGKSQSSNPSDVPKNTEEKNQRSKDAEKVWPSFCDVLVIGGGAVGSSVAYHLKERALRGLNVVVVEEDSTYKRASTVLSVGGIRQQFSVPENIQLSLYGMDFLRRSPELLAVEGMEPPDVQFNPSGYLTLASEAGVEQLKENFTVQIEMGAKVDFLSAQQLKRRYPWLNTDGVEAGVIGLENEGWFDPWNFLFSLRRKAVSLGAEYVNGKVTGLEYHSLDDMVTEVTGSSVLQNLNCAEITLPDGEKRNIRFSICVVAAGAWSGEVGRLVGIGKGTGIMGVPIPVEPRKRYVYCVHAPDGPGLDCPLLIDPNGTYFRREGLGGLYLCGQSPTDEHEPSIENLDVDYEFFESNVWPTIANRVSAFENLKLQSSWAGYYDYNCFDQNGIIGLHPIFTNMFIATGFSGHGIQQAAGVGRAVMESILHGEYHTINLERFGFERVLTNEPLFEQNIV
ncbi:FAD-dependent oxidoreductase domain-containing protein 1-like [Penaeus indicus]|uniref:FAD-dependent oxidoreductase domain-containing protein 1-like n=1 Tax=Penaeus indicus TaxID=29960 RepID=UPI00300D02A2